MKGDVMTTAEVEAEIGMATAHNAADVRWVKLARWWIEQYAAHGKPFTAEDILNSLADISVDTAERRALGSIMRGAARDGLIRPTGQWKAGTRVQSHSRPNREWVGA